MSYQENNNTTEASVQELEKVLTDVPQIQLEDWQIAVNELMARD